jgi:hypothetical protein
MNHESYGELLSSRSQSNKSNKFIPFNREETCTLPTGVGSKITMQHSNAWSGLWACRPSWLASYLVYPYRYKLLSLSRLIEAVLLRL